MNFKEAYWPEWQISRINYITKRFGSDYFKDKTILELAPFNGFIGNYFHLLGAKVTCIEGRKENYDDIREAYPHLQTHFANLDTSTWEWGKFDIIINWGLLYHLEKHHKEVLENCIKNSKLLLLETVISPANVPTIDVIQESGIDQSLSSVGGRPSILWVESIITDCGGQLERLRSKEIGAGPHQYDGSGGPAWNRCMWIIKNP
jgi:hypothetical protein